MINGKIHWGLNHHTLESGHERTPIKWLILLWIYFFHDICFVWEGWDSTLEIKACHPLTNTVTKSTGVAPFDTIYFLMLEAHTYLQATWSLSKKAIPIIKLKQIKAWQKISKSTGAFRALGNSHFIFLLYCKSWEV